jgi:hypothetical protein
MTFKCREWLTSPASLGAAEQETCAAIHSCDEGWCGDAPQTEKMPAMNETLERICDMHGIFLRREAEALGYHDQAIAKAVREGEWIRVRRGAYTFVHRWEGLSISARYDLVSRAVVRQSQTVVALSHTSALNQWGCPLWDATLDEVHVTRPDGKSGRRDAGVRQHRGVVLDGDVVEHTGLLVTSPVRAVLEYTTIADVEHSLVEVDDVLHRGLATSDQLRDRYAEMTHWPDTLTTDLILRLADGRSESVGESRTRFLCWRQGLPAPIPNYPVYDENGVEVARVDLAWPELGLFLEFDGKVKYEKLLRPGERASGVVFREKQREDMICRLTGWRCIRIVWADLSTPELTASRIRAMFRPAAA